MVITGVSGGSLSGTPVIVSINADTKTLTLSSAQTFSDGITLTLQAQGVRVIENAIGVGLKVNSISAIATQLSKTVRADVSGTTITLNGTYGVGKTSTIKGLGVDNSSTNTVQSVSASSSAGSAVVQVSQTLSAGTVIYFSTSRIITVSASIDVYSQPNTNRTVNLDLDKFIGVGVGS